MPQCPTLSYYCLSNKQVLSTWCGTIPRSIFIFIEKYLTDIWPEEKIRNVQLQGTYLHTFPLSLPPHRCNQSHFPSSILTEAGFWWSGDVPSHRQWVIVCLSQSCQYYSHLPIKVLRAGIQFEPMRHKGQSPSGLGAVREGGFSPRNFSP